MRQNRVLRCASHRPTIEQKGEFSGTFHSVSTVSQAMDRAPRSSSPVENLNSRLRDYFTLCRHLPDSLNVAVAFRQLGWRQRNAGRSAWS
ncbi:MAG: hypothetical protein QOF70_7684 [Acetobacteraceae bacterium]|nr:hypothetical protein [Acetobacteraceae bacterium]